MKTGETPTTASARDPSVPADPATEAPPPPPPPSPPPIRGVASRLPPALRGEGPTDKTLGKIAPGPSATELPAAPWWTPSGPPLKWVKLVILVNGGDGWTSAASRPGTRPSEPPGRAAPPTADGDGCSAAGSWDEGTCWGAASLGKTGADAAAAATAGAGVGAGAVDGDDKIDDGCGSPVNAAMAAAAADSPPPMLLPGRTAS